ncbi:MAG: DUF465 domain-containing protein [Alphaproteobacteria bacterium]|nr:DUF465 domain-containing protein [Alphaproteobacteria bacterium]OJV12161.1 MAG: hypothetical protein BGO27_05425 [Alphaproteobacteria bacterium 33-17]
MQDLLFRELEALKIEHQELEKKIEELSTKNQIEAQKCKKRKLWVKDRIHYLDSIIHPDIIA